MWGAPFWRQLTSVMALRAGLAGVDSGCRMSLRCCQSPHAEKPPCALILHQEECGTAGEGDLWSLRVLLTYPTHVLFSHSDQFPRL